MPEDITIQSNQETELLSHLEKRGDAESRRMLRFLAMPDLSRIEGGPIAEIVNRAAGTSSLSILDRIEVSEIVPADISFDLFNFPPEHPARSKSDTYYVDDNNILRTHTTVMWYYYVNHPSVKSRLEQGLPVGAISYGKVYRKDEIDRYHMNVFHQMDGWYLCRKSENIITIDDLQGVLVEIAQAIFGKEIKYRFNTDTFPYTDPSIEMEIEINGRWIELLGSGIVRPSVLKQLGVSEEYNGWAFGFGLERLAIASMELPDIRLLWSEDPRVRRQLKLGQKFVEVSKYPPITRDISFVVNSDFVPNNYFDLIRDLGGDLVEEVQLLDKYENEQKFGSGRVSYTYRIIYRASDRTLLGEEIDPIQAKIYSQTADQFKAELR